ncbi:MULTISPECIES: YdcF family protein [unclassified Neisseria]|uniref:YdcF family protein n=1 Tax=unclassified Neisseria TaxID=2623750 RepID=UPI001D16BF40|nr:MULTISPECIES: YdcF family protein [unclassified Neisseria]
MNKKRHMLLYLPAMLALCWFLLLIWVYLSAVSARRITIEDIRPAEAALVLGNAVNKNGLPNPCLRSRVAAAADLYHAGKVPKLVVSGGNDSDGSNEARHMKAIAVELGVPESRIAIEGKSENTYENILFSSIPLSNNSSVVIVSADYHLKRARWLADKQWGHDKTLQIYSGIDDCDEKAMDYPRKIVRESLAWVKASVKPE